MNIPTIILFILYTWCLGYSLTFFLKPQDFLETNIIRCGIGLGAIPIVGVILNLMRIPLDWRILLLISVAGPVLIMLIKRKRPELPEFKLTRANTYLYIAFLLAVVSLYMNLRGAFGYEYLENQDPYLHAVGAKFVATQKTFHINNPNAHIEYIDPYPPGYDFLMGILHQTSSDLQWTLKFFNSLIVSLGILFFYFFAKAFTDRSSTAIFATFILFSIPCYLTHFIWAHSLVMALFFPAMYCLIRSQHGKKNGKWWIPGAFVISGILLSQPTQPIKLGLLMGVFYIVIAIHRGSVSKEILFAGLAGGLMSVLWWGEKASTFISGGLPQINGETSLFSPVGGTATRAYNLNDYIWAQKVNLINNPVGFGIVISIMLAVSLLLVALRIKDLKKKENYWITVSVAWMIITFILVNTATWNLPLGLFAFRVWMLLAIAVSLICAAGFTYLLDIGRKVHIPGSIIVGILVLLILWTSFYPKFIVNTSSWYAGDFKTPKELNAYVSLKDYPDYTKVFGFVLQSEIIGMNKFLCSWCDEEIEITKTGLNITARDLHDFLKRNGYEYFIIGTSEAVKYGLTETQDFIKKLVNSKRFVTVNSMDKGAVTFKVR
jgi:hypothetical protein